MTPHNSSIFIISTFNLRIPTFTLHPSSQLSQKAIKGLQIKVRVYRIIGWNIPRKIVAHPHVLCLSDLLQGEFSTFKSPAKYGIVVELHQVLCDVIVALILVSE